MNDEYKKIIDEAPEDKSPIWYCDISYSIKTRNKLHPFTSKDVVVKGTIQQIKHSDKAKKAVLKVYFKYHSAMKKKVKEFDLSRIIINKVLFKRCLGYGVK